MICIQKIVRKTMLWHYNYIILIHTDRDLHHIELFT